MSTPGRYMLVLMPLLAAVLLVATTSAMPFRPPEKSSIPQQTRSEPDRSGGRLLEVRKRTPDGRAARTARRRPRKQPRSMVLRMRVTAYCPCEKCCGKFSDGKTASGKSIYTNGAMFVAADTSLLPFGTRVSIPGYRGGRPVPVLDRGGRIKGNRLDVFFLTHRQARQWGTRWLDVRVYLD